MYNNFVLFVVPVIFISVIFLFISCPKSSHLVFDRVFAYSSYISTPDYVKHEIATIDVGKIPTSISINPTTNLIYIANAGSNYISVINGSSNRVLFNITLEKSMSVNHVVVNPLTNIIYAGGGNAEGVFIINGSTNSESFLPLRAYPKGIAVNENTNAVYVTLEIHNITKTPGKQTLNSRSIGYVSVIDGNNNDVIKNIRVGTSPSAIVVNPKTNLIYVANNDYAVERYNASVISIINGDTGKLVDNLRVPIHPYDLAINKETNMVYVINEDGNRISVINGTTNKESNTIITSGSYSPGGIRPSAIVVNSNTDMLYTVNTASNHINVINTSNKKAVESTIAARGSILSDISVNPLNNLIYLADQGANRIYVLSNKTNAISPGTTIDTSDEDIISKIGINLEEKPIGMAVDSRANKLYIIYENSKKVTIIDGSTNRLLPPLVFNSPITGLTINPNTHVAYIINDTALNIIDPTTNKDKVLSLNGSAIAINLDPNRNMVYVLVNPQSSNGQILYVLDGATSEIYGSALIPPSSDAEGEAIAIDPNTEMIYVIGSPGISVINAEIMEVIDHISANTYPFSKVTLNPNTDILYLANENDRLVYAIDSYANNVLKTIKLEGYPESIISNPTTNLIYVANDVTGIVSVIDGNNNDVIKNIRVGTSPSAIVVNPKTNLIYVANTDSNTISIINGTTNNKVGVDLVLNVDPKNSGHIICGPNEVTSNSHILIEYGTQCKAESNTGFQFSSWVENLGPNSTKTLQTSKTSTSLFGNLNIMGINSSDNSKLALHKFGNYTANFDKVPPPIPPEYLFPLYGIILTSIVGWSIPSIIGWFKAFNQRRRLSEFQIRIEGQLKDGESHHEDNESLDKLGTDIAKAFTYGKINEQQYENLKDKTSIMYNDNYKKKIDSLNGTLEDINNDINDAYAKGKISKVHYDLLKEKISKAVNNTNGKKGSRVLKRDPVKTQT